MEDSKQTDIDAVLFRKPAVQDGKEVFKLIEKSKPLDLNSPYCYLLLCSHFTETCILAESGSDILGFISGYIHPQQSDTYFLWQIAIDQALRNTGTATRLLDSLLQRPNLRELSYLETTVTPSNIPSKRFFYAFARKLGTTCQESEYFDTTLFPDRNHEEEKLLRIGPFHIQPT